VAEYQYRRDNVWKAARKRRALLEMMCDPWTIRHLGIVDVETGWRCREVAGGRSIAAWLCSQVGADGHVMATDIDPRFREAIAAPNLEVRRTTSSRTRSPRLPLLVCSPYTQKVSRRPSPGACNLWSVSTGSA